MTADRATATATDPSISPFRWVLVLLSANIAAGLFSIVVYFLVNFFWISWLLFANLLFVGFPLGGYSYLRYIDGRPTHSVRRWRCSPCPWGSPRCPSAC